MRWIITIAFLWLALLTGGAWAQEAGSGWLDVVMQNLTKEEADALGWEAPHGVKLVKPTPGGPAETAGLLPGDIVVALDSVEFENMAAFIAAVSAKAPGTAVKLRLLRAGKEKTLTATLTPRPPQFAAAKPVAADASIPMLDTGGHMGQIWSIVFTPDGRQLVSASNDKTIRVWDAATGKTVRTIRGEAAPGDPGKVYAMVLSPDGKWLAAGGWFAPTSDGDRSEVIRVYDFTSGKLVSLLNGGHRRSVFNLAFSPDGRHLISGSGDFTAIIWDVAGGNIVHHLKGHRAQIYAVSFTPDGARAVTGSLDHDLRLWSVADGALLATMTGHEDKVRSLAVAPDGRIASGDVAGEIRLWDGQTGKALKTLARRQTSVGSLGFSPDGKRLLSTCGQGSCASKPQIVYDTASGRETVTYRGHDNIVLAAAISPDGRWAATGGGANHEIHIWDLASGLRRKGPDGQPLTLGGSGRHVWAAGVSADGRRIGWGNTWTQSDPKNGYGPLEYALTLSVGDAPLTGPVSAGDGAFLRARAEVNGWSLEHRKGGNYGGDAILDIKQGGKVVASIERGPTDGYDHRSYTFAPDGETIISGGSNGLLTAYDRAGHKLGDYIGHEGCVWAVAPSPDGRYLVSGSVDQTLRLWNLKTRELLVTLYRGADGEWVMWTPQGYYAASGPGADLIGWQINHGPENAAEYVTAAQLRTHLNRPDIVAKAIQLASAEAAVKEAHADFKLSDLLAKPVPRLSIVSPAPDSAAQGGYAQVTVNLDATPDPVKLIRIHVNGRQVAEEMPKTGAGFAPGRLAFTVPLANGANKIAIAAVNDTGETVATVNVPHNGDGALDKRGTLYILAIGVDKYPNMPGNDLRYAGADAEAFAGAMERHAGPLHEKIVKRVLVNGAAPGDMPTAANITDALTVLGKASEADTVMLFVSGHGINEGANYRFGSTDAAWADGRLRPSSVVPWYAFQEALTAAKGRRILFLDTCHSGNAFNQKMLSDSYHANIIVYSSARWDQLALEDPALGGGHGLFTYALVEGVHGGARDGAGEVRAEALRDFLRGRVKALAAKFPHVQEPQYFQARDAENYLLARGR